MAEQRRDETLQEYLAPPEQLLESFHMVNRLLPDGQEVLSVPPDCPARDAIDLMRQHGFSQLPVVQGETVLGLFTFRAFSIEIANTKIFKTDFASLPVEEFLEHEDTTYAQLTDEFRNLLDVLDAKDSVVVSGQENLVAILTPMDVLRYLYSVANAFVLIEEIELNLRMLIHEALPDSETLHVCIECALSSKYAEDKLPQCLEEMSFDDYIALIRTKSNWVHFVPVFGGTRERAKGRLEPVRDHRNDVFHFRRELSIEDHEQLANCRNWLYRCMRKVQARRKKVR